MTKEVILVHMKHIRAVKMCSRGTRIFFQRHGMDWSKFLKEGLPVEEFEATGDAMAMQVAEVARGRK